MLRGGRAVGGTNDFYSTERTGDKYAVTEDTRMGKATSRAGTRRVLPACSFNFLELLLTLAVGANLGDKTSPDGAAPIRQPPEPPTHMDASFLGCPYLPAALAVQLQSNEQGLGVT